MSKFSILHISDLHKMEGTTYEALLQSLLTDRDSYVEQNVLLPRYIVVSGDLIQGGETIEEIRKQYGEVTVFLHSLVREFLGNDKQRLLMVPGNHDVSFPHSRNSMTAEAVENKDVNLRLFRKGNTNIRWNWKELNFFKVVDSAQYEERLNLFKEFYDNFYEGYRQYPDNAFGEAEYYSFDGDKVTFTLFNSCHHLDHLNDTADIDEDAIVNVTPRLRASYNRGYLNIAVWHHHFYGTPQETNYMDREVINKMSHSYLQLGLFGHQHITQVAEFYGGDLSLGESPDNQRILLVSSGTLFGGNKQIPPGYKRQYNVIEVEWKNGTAQIEIHVREDSNRNVASKLPIWSPKQVSPTASIKTSVKLKQQDERAILTGILREATQNGDYISAFEKLKELEKDGIKNVQIRSEVLRGIKDNRYILENLEPSSKNDYMLLMACAERENDAAIKERLKGDEQLQRYMDDSIIKEMYERL